MTRNAYVDESQRPGFYAVAAVAVAHRSVEPTRRALRELQPRGQVRRHFVRESDQTRKQMLAVFRELPGCDSVVVFATRRLHPLDARALCLAAIAAHLVEGGLASMVLDHVDAPQAVRDRRVLHVALAGTGAEYRHESDHSAEPMLWLPDAIAWCAGRSGWSSQLDWVSRIEV